MASSSSSFRESQQVRLANAALAAFNKPVRLCRRQRRTRVEESAHVRAPPQSCRPCAPRHLDNSTAARGGVHRVTTTHRGERTKSLFSFSLPRSAAEPADASSGSSRRAAATSQCTFARRRGRPWLPRRTDSVVSILRHPCVVVVEEEGRRAKGLCNNEIMSPGARASAVYR